MKTTRVIGAALACCAMSFGVCATYATAYATDKGDQAPDFSLASLDNTTISLDQLKGKVVYLDFWASWCGPCRFSLPFMNTLHAQYGKDGLVVLAINIDTDRARAERALADVSPQYSVLLDPTGSVPGLYNPGKMPTSFIIGRDGTVKVVHEGFKPEDSATITAAIESALKEER